MARIASGGPAAHPNLQPVMDQAFDHPPIVIVLSFPPSRFDGDTYSL